MITFKELGLSSSIIKGLDDLGFVEPSPVQEKTIPFILESKQDLIALAQTGTGKTAAFSLPIVNQLKAKDKALQVIVICPIRELCLQIAGDIKKFTKYSKNIHTTAVYGGERIEKQITAIRRGTNIVVGTPGRVHDLIRRKILRLSEIKWLVLDEADEMLDMGFKDDLDAILSQIPDSRQTLLFSATMPKNVEHIAKNYMSDAKEISIGDKNIGAENVTHEYYVVGARDRFVALQRILDFIPGVYGILFCRTRNETQIVADKLKQAHYDAEALHGDISQAMRTKIMDRFKHKQVKLLVATDVAARGIDVQDLTHVINYNLPDQNEAYTHRSGRTGRAQKSGVSVSILAPREVGKIKRLESIIGKSFERKQIPDGKNVCLKQIKNYLAEVSEIEINKIEKQKYLEEIIDKLKKVKKEDLIKQFIAHKFNHLLDTYNNTRDLNFVARESREKKPRMKESDAIYLRINVGKRSGMDVKGIFGIINANKSLKGIEVGKISLMPEYSIFSVDKKSSARVLKFLKKTKFRGKSLDINITSVSAANSYSRNRRGKRGGGRTFKSKNRR